MNNKYNEEYLNYLISNFGLLNDFDLYEIGINYDEYYNPTEDVLNKIENYLDKKSRN